MRLRSFLSIHLAITCEFQLKAEEERFRNDSARSAIAQFSFKKLAVFFRRDFNFLFSLHPFIHWGVNPARFVSYHVTCTRKEGKRGSFLQETPLAGAHIRKNGTLAFFPCGLISKPASGDESIRAY